MALKDWTEILRQTCKIELESTDGGQHYIGVCPFCHTRNMALSVERAVIHCFGCGSGRILQHASLAPFAKGLHKVIANVTLPTPRTAQPFTASVAETIQQEVMNRIVDHLPPNLIPFFECAELLDSSPKRMIFAFRKNHAVAAGRCQKDDAKQAIARAVTEITGTPREIVFATIA